MTLSFLEVPGEAQVAVCKHMFSKQLPLTTIAIMFVGSCYTALYRDYRYNLGKSWFWYFKVFLEGQGAYLRRLKE